MLQELRQTLRQVSDNSDVFQSGLRDSLRLQVSFILAELNRSKSHISAGAKGRLDSLLHELEKEFQSDKNTLTAESPRLLSDLDTLSKGYQLTIRNTHSEIAAKISLNEHEISALLGKAFDQIVQLR